VKDKSNEKNESMTDDDYSSSYLLRDVTGNSKYWEQSLYSSSLPPEGLMYWREANQPFNFRGSVKPGFCYYPGQGHSFSLAVG
jgi:hypothetical protein